MVTQGDIAAAAGVSVMTVSLALRNRPEVASATAARVRELAARLGYRPDPALSALVHHRRSGSKRITAAIALLTSWPTRDAWIRTPVGRLAWEGARQRAQDYGYRLDHLWLGARGAQARRVSDILLHRGIRGVVLAPIFGTLADMAFPWDRFATITLERYPDFPPLAHVSPNHYADLTLAWTRLRALGYRRIGLAAPAMLMERGQHRWEAAQLIQQQLHAARRDRIPTLLAESTEPAPIAETDRWLRRYRPDVVVSPSPEFRQALIAGGWRIPQDVAYASLQIQLEDGNVAGINQHRDQMGAACIDALHARLMRSEIGIPVLLTGTTVDGEWVEGPTAPSRL